MRVLIADDHAVVREGLKMILKKMESITFVEEAASGNEAYDKLENNEYDLVIMDISMPVLSGLDILKIFKDRNKKGKFLILSVHKQEQYAIRALKLGASGYITKDSVYEDLNYAIKTVLSGKNFISPSITEKIISNKKGELSLSPHEKLSEREFQIMCMLAKGISVKEISVKLFISDKTVSTHRMRILDKMGMKKNAELTSYALKNDLIE
ncbi:MAG: response regulator transcription factor [Ignavibacteriae bacterium]|nr:response regulator transcription factor [Ignavibacteriota bacterium]